MAAAWDLVAKAVNTNLGYSYYPGVWEDNGKVYVRAQGELDINIYDIATDTWSGITMQSSNHNGQTSTLYVKSEQLRQELIWVANSKIYLQLSTWDQTAKPYLYSLNISTAARISTWNLTSQFGSLSADSNMHGDWGRNRHKQVVKDETTGKIYLINFYKKQIYEFVAASETFSLVKTWTETVGGVSTDDVTGCDAVCVNGKIYIMGKQAYAANSGGIAGPLEIEIATWNTATRSAYPDYAESANQTYNHYCDSQWFPIGNLIYGIGGRMQSTANADGSGTSESAGNILRQVSYDTINDSWADLAAIDQSFLYGSAVGYNTVGLIMGGYLNGSATQITNQFTYLPTPATGLGVAYDYSGKTLTVNWVYDDVDPSGFLLDYKKGTETSWSTEYLCDAIPGDARSISINYTDAACNGTTCHTITYTYANSTSSSATYETTNFSLTAADLETYKYLFRLSPVVVF